ncbi:XRE family transcriptional regulator [Methylobacterium komagatae]|uniref:XRE family transcriptional regulator n=1 Tax=Methylobacterium komagatae TaxID=374425 RepID=A0ABW2BQG6_9HYPH
MDLPFGEKSQPEVCRLALDCGAGAGDFRQMDLPEIKLRRKAKGLTLEQVASMVDLSVSQVSRFESGEREPKISEIFKLAEALDCSVEDLIGERKIQPTLYSWTSGSAKKMLLPVPVIGTTAAGVFREIVEFDDAEPEYVFELEDEDYPKARRFALTVEGDSMDAADPPMPDGCRVICVDFEQTGQPITDGLVVVIQRTREGGHLREWSVKEVELHDDEVWFCPRSANKKHRPIKVPFSPEANEWNSLEVIGLVRDVSMRVRRSPRRRQSPTPA